MPERVKVVFTMQGAIQVLGFTFTFTSSHRHHLLCPIQFHFHSLVLLAWVLGQCSSTGLLSEFFSLVGLAGML